MGNEEAKTFNRYNCPGGTQQFFTRGGSDPRFDSLPFKMPF